MTIARRAPASFLALVTLVSLAWVATPIVLIRPFGAQTQGGLALSYALRSRSASVTLVLLGAGLVSALVLRPRLGSWKGRALTAGALLVLAGCARLARFNHFEWMFRPLPEPGFAEAAGAPDVHDEDLVLGVALGTDARAYPVRALAYHHVVNDVLAGEPIVATY